MKTVELKTDELKAPSPTWSALWGERVLDALIEACEKEGLSMDDGGWQVDTDSKGFFVEFNFTFRPTE